MANTITQAVVEKFAASGSADFVGSQGLWFGQIPPDKDLPFLGFIHNGETPKYTTEKDYKDIGSFNFSVYAEGIAETERLALIVLDIYDVYITKWSSLNFTGGHCAEWQRTRYQISLEPIESIDAKIVGRADIRYDYTTVKILP